MVMVVELVELDDFAKKKEVEVVVELEEEEEVVVELEKEEEERTGVTGAGQGFALDASRNAGFSPPPWTAKLVPLT